MAKNKKNKKKPGGAVPVKLSDKNLIIQKGRSFPVERCSINKQWKEFGVASVDVLRRRPNGKGVLATYLIDIYCLGLKDTGYVLFEDEFEEEMYFERFNEDESMETIEANMAFNIIYGAIEYAEDLGFQPHKDFNITEYLLPPADTLEYIEIEFGKDGKPFYFQGPHDNATLIINKLNNSVGEGNYEYVLDERGFGHDYDYDDIDDDYDYDDDERDDDEGEYIDYEEIK